MLVRVHIRDLMLEDLPQVSRVYPAQQLPYIELALERAQIGDVDFLAVSALGPQSTPVSAGGIDYTCSHDAARIWQLATLPSLRSRGLGSMLIDALEARAQARGFQNIELAVDPSNHRARTLYERLGYQFHRSELPFSQSPLALSCGTSCDLLRKEFLSA